MESFRRWRTSVGSVGGVGGVIAWVACLRGWRASVGEVDGQLTWFACYYYCYCYY